MTSELNHLFPLLSDNLQECYINWTEAHQYPYINIEEPDNLQECYIRQGEHDRPQDLSNVTAMLLHLVRLKHLKVLHFETSSSEGFGTQEHHTLSQLEKPLSTEFKSVLQDLKLYFKSFHECRLHHSIINSVIRGVSRSKSIQAFSLTWQVDIDFHSMDLSLHEAITLLLKAKCRLQVLALDIPDCFLSQLADILEVNIPLTTLEIGHSHKMTTILPQSIKGLRCLILNKKPEHIIRDMYQNKPYIYPVDLLLPFHPNLQQLYLLVNEENIIKLFTILEDNTTLKALTVFISKCEAFNRIDPTLQNMLTVNQTMEYLNISCDSYAILSTSILY